MRLHSLPREVVNEAERISDVASRKIRLILDDFATGLYEPEPGFLDVINRYFQNWSQRRAQFDEQVDVRAVEADHIRLLVRDLESETVDVARRCLIRIGCLNQNVRTKSVCHVASLLRGAFTTLKPNKASNHGGTIAILPLWRCTLASY